MPRWLTKYGYYLYSIWELLTGFEDPLRVVGIFTGLAGSGVKTIRLRHAGLRFKVRGAMDVWSVKETFLDRFYERCGFAIQPGWTILDIGAGAGDFTLLAARADHSTRVFAFEPFPESFALLQENLHQNGIANVQIFNEAVGAESGRLTLDLSGGEPLQFQSRSTGTLAGSQQLVVKSISLVDIIGKLRVESLNLVKLDCEGAEYDILFGTPRPVLERIHRIVMEYHDNVTEHTHADLARFLEEAGFVVESFPNPVHPDLGYLRAKH